MEEKNEARTDYVKRDEKATFLQELNLQSPGSRGWHRYQRIGVIRNDAEVIYVKDLGLSGDFEAPEFNFPILLEHDVAEAQYIADFYRENPNPEPHITPTDLVVEYQKEKEQQYRFVTRGPWKQFGYGN